MPDLTANPCTLLPPSGHCEVIERLELTANIVIELREHTVDEAGWATLTSDHSFFDLALSARPSGTHGYFVDYPGEKSIALGPLVFIPPSRPLAIEWHPGTHRSLYCGFEINRSFQDDYIAAELEAGLDIQNAFVREAMQRLAHEMVSPGHRSSELLMALWTISCIELGRYVRDLASANRQHSGINGDQIAQIDQQLQAPGKPLTLTEAAAICGLSNRHFSRQFQATTGKKYSAYLLDIRIERARKLLTSSAKPIKQIAWLCGFETQAAFTACFRQQVGTPPKEYRNAFTSLVNMKR